MGNKDGSWQNIESGMWSKLISSSTSSILKGGDGTGAKPPSMGEVVCRDDAGPRQYGAGMAWGQNSL